MTIVTTLKYDEIPAEKIREGVERRLGHTDNLMIVEKSARGLPNGSTELAEVSFGMQLLK